MDLLREHYGSDTSSDGNGSDDNEESGGVGNPPPQDVPAAKASCVDSCASSSVSVGSESRSSRDGQAARGGKKRPRPSPTTARQMQRKHQFVRAVPHTPGMWAGHIFFPLQPMASSSSASTCSSSVYDATNRAASRRLCLAAEELIEEFTTVLEGKCQELSNRGGSGCNDELEALRVVSHLPQLPLERDDSSSDDEEEEEDDDDESSASSDDHATKAGDRYSTRRLPRGNRQGVRADTAVRSSMNQQAGSLAPLHISLSRPFYLQQQSISSFEEHARKVLAPFSPMPITFDLSDPEILVNDERTRSFLTISAAQITQGAPVVRMIRAIDTVMKRFGQAPYYDEAKIHTSIASVSGDVRALLGGTSYDGKLEAGGRRARNYPVDGISKPTPNSSRATFMLDRVMLTFGTTKEYCILLEGK